MCSLDERTLSAVWPTTSRSYRPVPVVDFPRGKIGLRKAQVIRAKTKKIQENLRIQTNNVYLRQQLTQNKEDSETLERE